MATARDAREWARSSLRGIGNSLYTPFCGDDGDDIDWDAYRTLVRYCVGELKHPMLWCTSGIAEFWSLTLDERKRLLEVAIEEGRRANPDVVVQACTAATSAKDCLDLTRHARAGRRRHRLHPDTDDGGPRRGGRAELLPLHRRSHRHRLGHVQLAVLRLRADSGRGCAHLLGDPCRLRHEGGRVPAREQPAAARPRAQSDDLGVRPDRLPRGLAARGHRRARLSWAPPAICTKPRSSQ